jgi:ATP synthase protein I
LNRYSYRFDAGSYPRRQAVGGALDRIGGHTPTGNLTLTWKGAYDSCSYFSECGFVIQAGDASPIETTTVKRDTRRYIKELAYFSSIGLSVALAIFIGLAIGVYLDRRFATNPWCTLLFLGFGILAGFRNIGLAIKKSRKL